jgi:hypothetical protein
MLEFMVCAFNEKSNATNRNKLVAKSKDLIPNLRV